VEGVGSTLFAGRAPFFFGLAAALALMFLMPPLFRVRRLNLTAAIWQPLCFVGPPEPPG
jgi:hypothetical protein